jgi:TetR/AcrR family transcriptional regulator, cholesterol catabolism regulator
MNEELKDILLKVRELYMRYGIKSITMDDVASHLSISKKTLYKYVTDKDDLVGKIFDMELEQGANEMECVRGASLNAIEKLLMVSKIINHKLKHLNPATEYDLKKYYPHHYQKLVSARRQRMYKNVVANIEKGKEEGLYREDLDADVIGKLQVSRVENMVDNDFFGVDEFTSPRFFQEVFIYHIRGIANQKGIDFLENKLKNFDINDLTIQ